MDDSFKCEIKGLIDERLNFVMESLVSKNEEYKRLHKRMRDLIDKVEDLKTANEEETAYVKSYLEVNFNLHAIEEPAFYAQVFSDAIRFLRYFDLL